MLHSIAVCFAAGFGFALEPAPAAKPIMVVTGSDSRVDRTGFHRIESQAAFRKLWLEHLGKSEEDSYRTRTPAVEIDFDRFIVVALFRVEKANSRGMQVASVSEVGDRVTLRYENLYFQTAGGFGGKPPEIPVTPTYAFAVLPKTAKPIIVEEAKRSLKREPPKWVEMARLEARP